MEINKIIKKSLQFTDDLEKAFEKDITLLIEYMVENFDIYNKINNEKITQSELNENIKRTFYKMNDSICCAITKSGDRCSRKSHNKTNYCKMHVNNIYKYNLQNDKYNLQNDNYNLNKNNITKHTIFLYENNESDDNNDKCKNIDKTKMIKKFINDEFYYIDDKYIYDNNTFLKCGYIDKKHNKEEFVFTDDPFILEDFD